MNAEIFRKVTINNINDDNPKAPPSFLVLGCILFSCLVSNMKSSSAIGERTAVTYVKICWTTVVPGKAATKIIYVINKTFRITINHIFNSFRILGLTVIKIKNKALEASIMIVTI